MRRDSPRWLKLPAYAKLNLGLEVLGVRQDGYHELRTLFQTIDLKDDVELTLADRGVTIACDHPGVPTDDSNLAVRAARELLAFSRSGRGARIRLVKRIPVAGGLGGGSSDAATVLRGLDRLLGLGLGATELHRLARRLGADVPFFLVGGTALGLARGDEVYPLRRQIEAHFVLVDPQRPVSTAAVFRRVDESLTPRENGNTIFRFVSSDLEGTGAFSALTNELEAAALTEVPELGEVVRRIREILLGDGARMAALSGSGSSFFGLFEDGRQARRAESRLQAAGFRALRGRTITFEQYGRAWSRALGRSRGGGRTR